jgi:formylglycine-generating enzyme required for sulfatase activity
MSRLWSCAVGLCGLLGLCLFAWADVDAEPPAKEITNSIGMKFKRIPKGKFLMGSPRDEKYRKDDEHQHEVEITKDFYLGVYEVTQKQWIDVMGFHSSHYSRNGKSAKTGTYSDLSKPADGKDSVKDIKDEELAQFPVENVSYEDVEEFIKKLNAMPKEKKAGRKYRLPTEAQWEYACRAGAKVYSVYHFGDTISPKLANVGRFTKQPGALGRTCKVGSYAPNAFGLYDMHGNVSEWCSDWHDKDYYKNSPKRDPAGPQKGTHHVTRGGTWLDDGRRSRSATRVADEPGYRRSWLGVRLVLIPGE